MRETRKVSLPGHSSNGRSSRRSASGESSAKQNKQNKQKKKQQQRQWRIAALAAYVCLYFDSNLSLTLYVLTADPCGSKLKGEAGGEAGVQQHCPVPPLLPSLHQYSCQYSSEKEQS
ncbi:hypothetical protein NHX12_009480 [Muraenolepis orangiensis]|uniref:Uncharacterized protein n=1 Tax=Muraenolepis orangiensis TaxID=630683 RepID=A0A9Q0I9J4_9TELE|nr:hypothetical protein NHX12_009480 [Muraenolepis orangiensis]